MPPACGRPPPGARCGYASPWSSNGVVFKAMGARTGAEWLTGYLLEKSLSVDNLFVFVLLFTAFRVEMRKPAPDPLLGHPVRVDHARGDDPGGNRPAEPLRMDDLGVRRLPRLHGLEDVLLEGRGAGRSYPVGHRQGLPADPSLRSGWRAHPLHGEAGREAVLHAHVPGPARRGGHGPRVRRGFDPGRAGRDPGSLHGLHLQHLRDPGPQEPLLTSWRR